MWGFGLRRGTSELGEVKSGAVLLKVYLRSSDPFDTVIYYTKLYNQNMSKLILGLAP